MGVICVSISGGRPSYVIMNASCSSDPRPVPAALTHPLRGGAMSLPHDASMILNPASYQFESKVDVAEVADCVVVGFEPFTAKGSSPDYIIVRAERDLELDAVAF